MQEQKQCNKTSVNEYAALFSDNEQIVIGACVKEIKKLLAEDEIDSTVISMIFDFVEIIEDCNNQTDSQHILSTNNVFGIMFLLRSIQGAATTIKKFKNNERVVIRESEFIFGVIDGIFEELEKENE